MKAFCYEIVFREIQTCFLHGGEACFEPIKAARFFKKLEVHSVLYGQEMFVFKRQFSWTFPTFFYILTSA